VNEEAMARVGPQRHMRKRKRRRRKRRRRKRRRRKRRRRKKYERNGCKHYTVISCPEVFFNCDFNRCLCNNRTRKMKHT